MKNLLLIFFLTTLCYSCSEGKKDKRISHSNILAYNLLADQIKGQILKSPATAVFPNSSKKAEHTKYLGEHTYMIESYVESQNGFGAIIKTNFSSKVRFKSDGGVSFPGFRTY